MIRTLLCATSVTALYAGVCAALSYGYVALDRIHQADLAERRSIDRRGEPTSPTARPALTPASAPTALTAGLPEHRDRGRPARRPQAARPSVPSLSG